MLVVEWSFGSHPLGNDEPMRMGLLLWHQGKKPFSEHASPHPGFKDLNTRGRSIYFELPCLFCGWLIGHLMSWLNCRPFVSLCRVLPVGSCRLVHAATFCCQDEYTQYIIRVCESYDPLGEDGHGFLNR